MPSLRAIASSIFALALVSAPGAQAGASGASTYLCVYKVKSLKKQNGAVAGATKYNFAVTGCNAGEEFAGRCPDLTSFPGCGGYNVVVSSASKTSKPKVTSVKKQASK
ncbi:hypothetical protein PR003_g28447 [Phytophthora rubi]|uniref:Pectate lyase n=1 Tax=Phytophthora rubi TaxID=129364 RepID=A0A6A4BZV1_9STRA|nr:hypothetical protein PR002_g27335 [Phytophthora rubi]KAE8970362.1 hypothetical protein PR001_g27227 [Phytophthora rubi]KAE9278694.1 hypothetical protein PR003_g28447 [Phytophthora rubi]